MLLSTWALSAVLLLIDAASAKAISPSPLALRRTNRYDEVVRRIDLFEAMERRNPQPADTATDSTITTACMSAVSSMTTVSNFAGFAGCYNIITWDPKTALFQADLRLYQQETPFGDFANVSASQITVMLAYPASTVFKSVTKRSTIDVTKRGSNAVQIQQYTLAGNFKSAVDMSRLNQTQLASLLVPQISLQAKQASTQKLITTNMTATDSAWFVAGQFTNVASQALQVANPATAVAALVAAKGFVLPGTTFGIFPTGLIVTSVWMLFFVSAYGIGTIGRIRSRQVYRKRVLSLASRGIR